MTTQRPLTILLAVALQGLLSLLGVAFGLSDLIGGVDPEGPPMFIVILSLVIGLVGLVAAWGLWQGKRWGMISTIILRAVDGLAAVPGIFLAPTLIVQLLAGVGVVLSVVVIALLILPTSRRVYA